MRRRAGASPISRSSGPRSCGRWTRRASRRAAATARAGAWWSSPTRRPGRRCATCTCRTGGPTWSSPAARGCWPIRRPSSRAARRWCGAPTSTPSSLDAVPVHLVLGVRLADLAVTDEALPRTSIVGGASIYPFAQNLLLALRNEGLGASMTTLLVPAEREVRELLGIPEDVALAAHIGVGHRAEELAQVARAPPRRGLRLRRALRRSARALRSGPFARSGGASAARPLPLATAPAIRRAGRAMS